MNKQYKKYYCHTNYYIIPKNTNNDLLLFKKGEYYDHSGAREMISKTILNNTPRIVGFGTLENWKKYFLDEYEDIRRIRNLKINDILNEQNNIQ